MSCFGLAPFHSIDPLFTIIDSPNNSIEDVSVTGPSGGDGILLGSRNSVKSNARSNVLMNIRGAGLANGNVVHLSNNTGGGKSNCPGSYNACDITIMGVTSPTGVNPILDSVTGTTVPASTLGMYVLGEQIFSNSSATGYARLTTNPGTGNPGIPTWLVGSNPQTPCATGALYSCVGGSCSIEFVAEKTPHPALGAGERVSWNLALSNPHQQSPRFHAEMLRGFLCVEPSVHQFTSPQLRRDREPSAPEGTWSRRRSETDNHDPENPPVR
jgi:hypothetical protein